MESGLFDMWDYAKKNAKTTKNVWDSFADDLDASVGIGQWRVSRNMDEQPKPGETAVCFTFADGDEQGDFQVFLKKQPKMSVVIETTSRSTAFLGWSARQATHVMAILNAIAGEHFVMDADPDYVLEQVVVDRPQTRLSIAMDYAENEETALHIVNSGALDDNEKKELWDKRVCSAAQSQNAAKEV